MKQELLRIDDIREIENASEEAGLSKGELMDRAGSGVASLVANVADEGYVVVLCGNGNNGGDGWVAARLLQELSFDVEVICAREPSELKPGIAQDAAIKAHEAGVPWVKNPTPAALADRLSGASLVIDAVFGAGFHGVVGEPFSQWLDCVSASRVPVLAVDVPTGLSGDTGIAEGKCLQADWTLATIAGKLGMVGGFGGQMAGEVIVDELGIDEKLPGAIASRECAQHWSESEYAALLPHPSADVNKYSRGYMLVVGGSTSYPGAAVMASSSAARSGSGYVRLCVPDPVVPICQSHLLSIPVEGFPAKVGSFSDAAASALVMRAARADAVVLGPGIGVTEGTREVVSALIAEVEAPLLIDADALGIVADMSDALRARAEAGRKTVLTPHEGEMRRLLSGIDKPDALPKPATPAERIEASNLVAHSFGSVCVLKGPATVISDGQRCVLNGSGCAALATSGTGDVLSGIIGALLSQDMDPLDAAALGVHIHGLAGEEAAYMLDEICVVAEDVIDCIPQAIATLSVEEDS